METEHVQMSYREKTAWLSLAAIVVTFGPYFVIAGSAPHPEPPMPNLHMLSLLAGTLITQTVIMIVGYILLAAKAPQEARTPPDERDREITRRAITCAYYVLITGMILVGCVMPFNSGGWTIINTALFMIVLAELVHYGLIVFSYRRQA